MNQATDEVAEALAGEAAALEAIERVTTDADALWHGLQRLTSDTARRSFQRSLQKAFEAMAPSAGKQAAVGLYVAGVVDLQATQAAFDEHPEWRHA